MAYRQTEKVLAQLEARKASIIASAIDVIAKGGIEGFTTDAVAERAEIAAGLIYRYFPDKTELLAAIAAQLLARDLNAIREAAEAEKGDPLRALAAGIAVFFHRLDTLRVVRMVIEHPLYEKGIRESLERLIRAAMDASPAEARLNARAVLGALRGMVGAHGPPKERASAALLFALRGIGISDVVARRLIDNSKVPA